MSEKDRVFFIDVKYRLDRIEEICRALISCVLYCKDPNFINDELKEWLKDKKKNMYEEQAAAKGDQDE